VRDRGDLGQLLENDRVVDRLLRRLAPGERAVPCHQHHRGLVRIAPAETVDDLLPGLGLVVAPDRLRAHHLGAGDILGQVVGVGRAEDRDRQARLGPCRGVGRVGVDDPAQSLERPVESRVRLAVRRRAQRPLDRPVVQIDHDHVGGGELFVGDAARLDREDAPLGIKRRDVAEGVDGEAPLGDLQVDLPCLLLQSVVRRFHSDRSA
jgi:hypothetical protein